MKKITLLALCATYSLHAIVDLKKLNAFAQKLTEFPQMDNTNLNRPDYTTYLISSKPGTLKQWFSSKQTTAQILKDSIESVTEDRQLHTGDFVTKLIAQPESRFYIWGDLQGAFHSLIRSLNWLNKQKVITPKLKILDPNVYFIFNGNGVGHSAHNIETLITLLTFMKLNPNQVFYIKGAQEDDAYWTNFNLKEELKIKATHISDELVPLEQNVNDFFNTLPLALFITEQDSSEFIRISPTSRPNTYLYEDSVSHALQMEEQNNPIERIKLLSKLQDRNIKPLDTIAIIKSENTARDLRAKNGMALLDQDQGATAWSFFSSPLPTYQEYFDFNLDAFGLLSIKKPLSKSTITVFTRHIKSKEQSFEKQSSYNLVTGLEIMQQGGQKAPDLITIGSSMALVQGVPIMGQRTKRGMNTRILQENQNGGIHGRHLNTVVYNDNYTPFMTRTNINRLRKKNKTDIILLPVGSPTLGSYLDYVKNKDVIVLFPITGGPQFRDPELEGIVHFRGTYADEVRALVDYMVTERGARKFAFFYQDDAYGQGPRDAAHEQLEKKGITTWLDVPYQRNSTNYKEQAKKIKQYQPDAIGLFSTAQATIEVLRQIGVDFLTNKQLFGISFLGEESYRRFMKQTGLQTLFGAVVPNPRTSNLQIVQEYRKEMDKNKHPYDIFSLEAYITTSILLDALKKIEGPITKNKILEQLESLNEYPFKGLTLTFNPQRRDLARSIWIETGDNQDWVRKEIDLSSQQKKDPYARNVDTNTSEQLTQRSASPPTQPMAPRSPGSKVSGTRHRFSNRMPRLDRRPNQEQQ